MIRQNFLHLCNNFLRLGIEGMCILLRRFCYPNRLTDLVKLFKRDATVLSRICNWMTKFIAAKHGHLLRTLNHKWMNQNDLDKFSKVS